MGIQDLPAINACLNGLSTVFLTCGFWAIRRKCEAIHRKFMLAALCTSALFLACYLTYHFNVTAVTRFLEPPEFRPFYLAILLSHTVLAAVLLPLVVGTVWNAARRQFDRHSRWARWTWPIWMYVSVTGVLIYLLLYQIFPQTSG
jgi:uncharacterized membrane protein YozB (DUF420 family)